MKADSGIGLSPPAQELRRVPDARCWRDAPLEPFTTFGSGGRADLLVTVETVRALIHVLGVLESSGTRWTVLGAGSNVLVPDGGYRGVVLKLGEGFSWFEAPVDSTDVLGAGAASPLPRLTAVAAEQGLSGLEFACSIPGTVGGAVAMNAGAHGSSIADVAQEIELVCSEGSAWVPADDLSWEYRGIGLPDAFVVTGARLKLGRGEAAGVLGRQRLLQRRRRKEHPRGVRTFGSVFKNPPDETAGRLLDVAGMKGIRWGGAEVSGTHANFIVNVGGATTGDVLALMRMMREAVLAASGVVLEPEVRLLGSVFPWEVGCVDGANR